MSFLIDTNVVSEWAKPRPNPDVVRWLADADDDQTYLSVVTLAELRYGVERLSGGQRKMHLAAWLSDELVMRFEGRIITIDAVIAETWGRFLAKRDAAGQRMDPMDAFIAATAQAHDLKIVTRNTADFDGLGIGLINPWFN